ncbi:sulfotransferase [Synechococcus sp. CS-1328]|uniref:sulfotransferase family protein n=1 Tax=Synechococcus sp. CS-1328 TaxID=2847976 RepID=UPI00223B4E6D|nr:sulfotransferase [Synechococcus sp. CS-1328]MCT0224977.1 sulfotransferase [Synechococcus sp. CS-1328]
MAGAREIDPTAAPLPDFLGLGVQKGGTTTLQRLLERHPQVFLPAGKEVHFFSLHYGEGEAWYRHHYAAAAPHQRCGDITPYYLFHPAAPGRIQALLPQARLIVLLRDPVERALSQYFHSRRLGLEPLDLDAALAAEPQRLAGAEALLAAGDGVVVGRHRSHQEHSYLSRSRYEQQLDRYEALFPPGQLLLLRSEDLFAAPERIWPLLLEFLALDPCPLPAEAASLRANAGRGEAGHVPEALRRRLRQELEPTYRAMAARYGISWP